MCIVIKNLNYIYIYSLWTELIKSYTILFPSVILWCIILLNSIVMTSVDSNNRSHLEPKNFCSLLAVVECNEILSSPVVSQL